jgi:hypothetical protein
LNELRQVLSAPVCRTLCLWFTRLQRYHPFSETPSPVFCILHQSQSKNLIKQKPMSKALKFALAAIIALILIAFMVLTLSINSIVKSGIEQTGSEMTGTPVTADRVSISPFSGKGEISGFRVANPGDYSNDYAFQVEDFQIELDIFSLFSDEIVIREIVISAPSIWVEQKLPENNIRTIMRHIQNIMPGEASDKAMVIERFRLTGGSVDLYTEVGGERSARVEISDIELTDLGRGGGRAAVEEVIREIAERIAEEALQGAARSGGEQIRDAIRDLFN